MSSPRGTFRLTIGTKIFLGFLSLILLSVVAVAVIFWKGSVIDNSTRFSAENARPSKEAINDFVLMVTQSKMLITNWVYLQTNQEDKQTLRQIKDFDYPALKERISKLEPNWDAAQRARMDSAFLRFENMMKVAEENIITKLVSFENYEDPLTKLLAEDAVESQIIPQSTQLIKDLGQLAATQNIITAAADADITTSTREMYNYTLILGGVIVLLGFVISYLIVRSITNPINFLKNIVVKLGKGELVEEQKKKFSRDEIGEMAVAMDSLVSGLKATTQFAENIGKGKYDSDFRPLSERDVLGNALITMRNNLAQVAEEDKKRNWATEGMARFGEILRANNNNLEKLADEIISNLVKYLRANQGALYITDDVAAGEDPTLSMKACYAWDKKKYLNQQIHLGEGLAGQCWQERDIVFLTDVPNNYIRITSGLGDANPTCVLIVPLKVNDVVFGVVELAGFTVFREHEIEFVKKIAESIASTISSVKINARTQALLEESQQMTEQMRAQEEEMRQNMEELHATQEEMERKSRETVEQVEQLKLQEEELRQNMEEQRATQEHLETQLQESRLLKERIERREQVMALTTILSETDLRGVITFANDKFCEVAQYTREELLGKPHNIVRHPDMPKDLFRLMWKTIQAGEVFGGIVKNRAKDGTAYWVDATIVPIKDAEGRLVKYVGARYHLTDADLALKLYNKQAAQMNWPLLSS
jgi:PAS domain S-box-containing protein